MSTFRSLFRALAVASTLAFVAAPAMAFAGEGHPKDAAKEEGKHGKGKQFPVAADKFQKHVDKRIEKARAKLEEHMKAKNLPEDKRAAARKAFDAGAAQVQAAAKKAGEDGTVTKDEAKAVRELARSLRQKGHDKRGHGRGEKKHGKDA
jgi:hypothetical protein